MSFKMNLVQTYVLPLKTFTRPLDVRKSNWGYSKVSGFDKSKFSNKFHCRRPQNGAHALKFKISHFSQTLTINLRFYAIVTFHTLFTNSFGIDREKQNRSDDKEFHLRWMKRKRDAQKNDCLLKKMKLSKVYSVAPKYRCHSTTQCHRYPTWSTSAEK